jgi:hypothetical protein
MFYDNHVLLELYNLEKLSTKCAFEMRFLSKRIRNDLWFSGSSPKNNSRALGSVLGAVNKVFKVINEMIGDEAFFSLATVTEYRFCEV